MMRRAGAQRLEPQRRQHVEDPEPSPASIVSHMPGADLAGRAALARRRAAPAAPARCGAAPRTRPPSARSRPPRRPRTRGQCRPGWRPRRRPGRTAPDDSRGHRAADQFAAPLRGARPSPATPCPRPRYRRRRDPGRSARPVETAGLDDQPNTSVDDAHQRRARAGPPAVAEPRDQQPARQRADQRAERVRRDSSPAPAFDSPAACA